MWEYDRLVKLATDDIVDYLVHQRVFDRLTETHWIVSRLQLSIICVLLRVMTEFLQCTESSPFLLVIIWFEKMAKLKYRN